MLSRTQKSPSKTVLLSHLVKRDTKILKAEKSPASSSISRDAHILYEVERRVCILISLTLIPAFSSIKYGKQSSRVQYELVQRKIYVEPMKANPVFLRELLSNSHHNYRRPT